VSRQVVDISARSRLVREQPLASHAWVASPAETLEYLRHPRSELKKMGIRLPCECVIETVLQNHDWLAGRSHGLVDDSGLRVFARGEGDARTFYKVTLYASKRRDEPPEQPLLHRPDEEQRRARPVSTWARQRTDATRRSVLAAPLQLVVQEWLSPLTVESPVTKSSEEAHRIFMGIVDVARRLVSEDPSMETAMDDIGEQLQRPFDRDYVGLYRTLGTEGVPFQRAFIGLMYARALWWIQSSRLQHDKLLENVVERGEDPQPTFRILMEAIETLADGFVAHATVAATVARRHDSYLDDRLVEAERLFDRLAPGSPDESQAFTGYARGLEHFAPANRDEWWYLPGIVAFAVATWSVRRGEIDTTELT
jgi:hypothetical protein